MATATTFLSAGVFKLGAASGTAVDYTDQCSAVTFTDNYEALDASTFGVAYRYRVKGLSDPSITATIMVNATTRVAIQALVGTNVYAAARGSSAAISATNPEYQLTGALLASADVVNSTVGELETLEIEVTGGALVVDTTP